MWEDANLENFKADKTYIEALSAIATKSIIQTPIGIFWSITGKSFNTITL